MKQVFDDIREKLNDYIEEYSDLDSNGLHNLKWCAMQEALCVVNEAEQKWEEDCCEWSEGEVMLKSPHKGSKFTCTKDGSFKYIYCPDCGKKIKVVE